jgi:glycosyltransferase involved in cell wall biosynthesis
VKQHFPQRLWNNIVVTPRFERADLHDIGGRCQVALSTSLYEGFGKHLIEYAALSLPIISTAAGVAPELADDGAAALFNYDDHIAAAQEIQSVLLRPERRASMAQSAESAAERFTWPVVLDQWDSLLLRASHARSRPKH